MKKKIAVIGSILIVLAIVIGVVATSIEAKAKEAATEVVAETILLEKQDLEKVISVTGTIASSNMKAISSDVTDVKITELNVAVGDSVKKGDIIARLDDSNLLIKLNTAQTALDVAKQKSKIEVNGATRNTQNVEVTRNIEIERSNAAVAAAYKEYAEAVAKKDTTYQEYQNAINKKKDREIAYFGAKGSADNTVKETEIRRKAQESAQIIYDAALDAYELAAKVTIDPSDTVKLAELEALKKKKDDALTVLNAAKAAYSSIGAITNTAESDKTSRDSEYSQSKSDESSKEAEYKAALANVDTTTKAYQKAVQAAEDTVRTTQKAVDDQKDSLQSAQLNSKISGSSQEEIDVKKYNEQIEACVIIAPIDGIITSVALQVGDIYKSGDLITIQDTSDFTVSATVDQYDISDVFKDMKAIVKTETTGDTQMLGTVTFVSPIPKSSAPVTTSTVVATTTTSSNDYEIKVAIKEGSDRLRIGMTAKTSIILKEQKNAFVVPYYCIQEDTDGSFYITAMENIIDETAATSTEGKKIVVKKVLETDYFTAIEAEELVEGMSILVPTVTDDSLQPQ